MKSTLVRKKQHLTSLLALAGLVIALIISSKNQVVGLSVIGTIEIIFAISMELHSKEIWEHSVKAYKPRKKGDLRDKLLRPTKGAYAFNVYFLLPLLFVCGVTMLYVACTV